MSDPRGRVNMSTGGYMSAKMANDLSPKKTMVVLVIVVGCFAVLWPKVFYPMILGSANMHIKPSSIDSTKGCCDVISETDVQTLKIMSHICSTVIKPGEDSPLSAQALISECRSIILDVCGIDLSAVLQQQIKLGQTSRQILDQVRSLNGSLCLKYNFGVAPWSLGVPHRVNSKVSPSSVKQERPLHLRSEMVHPAFRERGRAIPQSQPQEKPAPPSRLIPKVIVPGRPGPVPGLRPTIGGAGHVVPAPKQGTGSMGLIMPIYTVGIIIFFTYTVMKVLFKKQQDSLYPSIDADVTFRKEVFESTSSHLRPRTEKDGVSSRLGWKERDTIVNAMSALLDEVDQELSARLKASEVTDQDKVANGKIVNREDDRASVKILGMETTASCEGGEKWSRPDSPVLTAQPQSIKSVKPPQEIYLEGSLPPQSHLLVTDSASEAQNLNSEDPAVVLAGKMTLSVISLDPSDNLTDEYLNSVKHEERSNSNASENFEKIEVDQLGQIEDVIEEAENSKQSLLDEIRHEINKNEKKSNQVDGESNIEKSAQEMFEKNENSAKEAIRYESTVTDDVSEREAERIENERVEQKSEIESEIIDSTVEGSSPVKLEETFTDVQLPIDMNNDFSKNVCVDAHPSPSEGNFEESVQSNQKPSETNGEAANYENEEEVGGIEDDEGNDDNEGNEDDDGNENDEEIEYAYEESDNDEIDEEIKHIERMSEPNERISERFNGGDFQHLENGTISNATLAENDISDEENSDEEVIEEIIEYVTDEEDLETLENNVEYVNNNK